MKRSRIFGLISITVFILVSTIGMTGCGKLSPVDNIDNRRHITQEEKENVLIKREDWNKKRIPYVPTPTQIPTPAPTLAPTSDEATVTCINKIYPSSVKKGESFNICGLISTDIGTIDNVSGVFTSRDGKVVTKTSDRPNSSTYEIKRSIVDRQLSFGDLELGEYTCIIKAKGSNFDETEIMRFDFIISTETVSAAASQYKAAPSSAPAVTPTKKPEPAKTSEKSLTDKEQEIINRVIHAVYPKNCKIVANYKKANDSGYEYYKVSSKFDEKSVSVIQEYGEDGSDIEAVDFYITTFGGTIKKFAYADGYGWRQEPVNKAYLTPEGCKTAVSVNLGDYLDNTVGGQWSVETSSSEYRVSRTGARNKSNGKIFKDITVITDRNYEIKSVKIKIQDTGSIFKGESGYITDISIKVSDKSKTTVSVPEEIITGAIDFE